MTILIHSALPYLTAARHRVRDLVPDLGHAAFSDSKAAEDIRIEFSLYADAYKTETCDLWSGSLADLAQYLTDQGKLYIRDKRNAPTMTGAVSRDGHRVDSSCAKITLLLCDADNVGDWALLLAYLDTIKVAYVVHRSSSHDEDKGIHKWHLFIPITEPLIPRGDKWKQEVYEPQYGWIIGVLSELGRLQEVLDVPNKEKKHGFDHSISDLIQPLFVGRKLKINGPDREVRYSKAGGTLNWDKFLEITGYQDARLAMAATAAATRPVPSAVGRAASYDTNDMDFAPGEFAQRLRTALVCTNLLGEAKDDHRQLVLCPWRDSHTSPDPQKDHGIHHSSTVLYTTSAGGIVFSCFHTHCTQWRAKDVWAWIKTNYPAAIPARRVVGSKSHDLDPVPMPLDPAPVRVPVPIHDPDPVLGSKLSQIWDKCSQDGTPPESKVDYLRSNKFLDPIAAAGPGLARYIQRDKSVFSIDKAARLRVLIAKQDPKDLLEIIDLQSAKLIAKDDCAVFAYRIPQSATTLATLAIRRLSDEGHANNRTVYLNSGTPGILGNPRCITIGCQVIIVDSVDVYLTLSQFCPANIALIGIPGSAYQSVLSLNLTDCKIYLLMDPKQAKSMAPALYAAPIAPAQIFSVTLPDSLTAASYLESAGCTIESMLTLYGIEIANLPPLKMSTPPGSGSGSGGRSRSRSVPEITVSAEIYKNVTSALQALAELPDLYQRNGKLVQVIIDNDPGAGIWRPRRLPVIAEISPAYLTELLSQAAHWVKAVENKKENSINFVPTIPPTPVVNSIHTRGILPGIRELKFITTTPTVRPEGTLITIPGYDPATGILYMPAMIFEIVPDEPSTQEILSSIKKILEVVVDFPFKNPAARSVWVTLLITRLARFIFDGAAPMFIFDANAPGTGKSRLVQCASLIADGEITPPLRYSGDPDEDDKRILSLLLDSTPIALWDNIDSLKELGHAAIDMLLTTTRYKGRILGKSSTPTCDNFAVWCATGNNIRLAGDTSRRTLRCILWTNEENPEARDNFTHPDLYTWILENRGALVCAALTLIRGWFAATKPQAPIRVMGSFEAWSNTVRQIVVWVGDAVGSYGIDLPDPLLANDADHTTSDEKMIALPALLKGWTLLCSDAGVPGLSVSEALETLKRDNESPGGGAPPPNKYRILRETIIELIPGRDGRSELPSPQRLSHIIRMFKRRVCTVQMEQGPKRLQFINGHDGARYWAVAEIAIPAQVPVVPTVSAYTMSGPGSGSGSDSSEGIEF